MADGDQKPWPIGFVYFDCLCSCPLRGFERSVKELYRISYPISYRIKYKIGLFVYKIIHNNAPHYLSDLIHPYSSAHTGLRSSGLMGLHEPRTSTVWGDRSFTAAAARVWNQLPLAIKLSSSIITFKKNLKSHLYKQAYSHNPQS